MLAGCEAPHSRRQVFPSFSPKVVFTSSRSVSSTKASVSSPSSAAQRWGVSRQTLHTWLGRYEADGPEGLADRSHRPRSCPHQMTPLVEAAVLELRRVHRAWGPRRLVVEPGRWGVAPLPSESGVYRALTRPGWSSPVPVVAVGSRGRAGSAVRRWSCGRWTSWAGSAWPTGRRPRR